MLRVLNLQNLDDIEHKYTLIDIEPNTVITTSMLGKKNKSGQQLVGIACNNLSSSVNGIIRTSDYIDIYVLSDETSFETIENQKPKFEKVYVEEAFNESGVSISNSDKDTIAKNFNLLVKDEQVEEIVTAVANHPIYVVKHIK